MLLGVFMTVFIGQAIAAERDWAGGWDTHWRDGGAHLDLKQDGSHVTGTYPLYDGQIDATAQGDQLQGKWIQGARSGQFLFSMAADGMSFGGRYDNGEWWTGGRTVVPPNSLPVDQSGIRQTLRTFVEGGNLAAAGVVDALGASAAVLTFEGQPAPLPQNERLAAAKALHQLIDLTSFQLWSLPGKRSSGTSYVTQLRQAGTEIVLSLQFSKQGDNWFIVAPSSDVMASSRKALLARYGGRFPEPSAYLRLRSARDTMTAFLADFARWNTGGREDVLGTIDTSQMFTATRDYEGTLAAQYLLLVLQRIKDIIPQEIPDDPVDRQPYVVFDHPAGQIVIAPVGDGDKTQWKFTARTVQDIRALYSAVETMPLVGSQIVDLPPSAFFSVRNWIAQTFPIMLQRFGPVEQWQILGAVVGILICYAAAWVIVLLISRLIRWDIGNVTLGAERALRWPLRLAVAAALFKLVIPILGWPEEVRQYSAPIHALIIGVLGVWSGWYLIDVLSHNMVLRARRTAGSADDITLSLCLGALRLIMVFVAAMYVANELSLPTNGVLAGLGLSGLAFAFASKETLSNVFGAGILVADHPFKKGDWITAGDIQGTVEKVGIRSTRIRTAEDTEAVVPNGKLSDTSIQNWGSRRHRLLKGKMTVNYGVSTVTINDFLEDIRRVADKNPAVVPDRTQVGVSSFGEAGVEIEYSCYLAVTTSANEKAVKSSIMLEILNQAELRGFHRSFADGRS